MTTPAASIRNVAFLGHSGTGKTTLVDALAFKTGLVGRQGSVEQGTSISDFEQEEQERKHSFRSAVIHAEHAGKSLNLIDCPGYPDFVSEAISSLVAVETAVSVISATGGVTFNTRAAWQLAETAHVGHVVVVTRNEAENTDFNKTVAEIQEAFGDKCVPVNFPNANGSGFSAVINCLDAENAPPEHRERAQAYYATLVERVAEADEELMMTYLDSGQLSKEVVLENISKAIIVGALVPILAAASREDQGVNQFLRFVDEYLPSPLDMPPRVAHRGETEVTIDPDPDGPLIAEVFKSLADQHVGRITFLRIFSGTLRADSQVYPKGAHKPVKLHGINLSYGREGLKPVDSAGPGSIVAITKLEDFAYGTTVSSEADPPQLPVPAQPHPWTALSIRPKSSSDDTKMAEGLRRLASEDPTFHLRREETTHELLVEGLGDLHLQILLERLKHRSKVEVETHLPRIPYKETVLAKAEGHHRHKKQSGGRGQFGEVYLRIAPKARGEGYEFIDSVVGGAIPRNLIPAVDKGIHESLHIGPISGSEVIDVAVEVYDGKFHPVDSDEASFKTAGRRAFLDAFQKAKPALLEPVYELEIRVPSRFLGDITSDINTRRGRIQGMDTEGDIQVIKAHVPLSEVQSYSSQLRSITAGEGSYAMSFVGYEQAPAHVQEKVASAHKTGDEE